MEKLLKYNVLTPTQNSLLCVINESQAPRERRIGRMENTPSLVVYQILQFISNKQINGINDFMNTAVLCARSQRMCGANGSGT